MTGSAGIEFVQSNPIRQIAAMVKRPSALNSIDEPLSSSIEKVQDVAGVGGSA
jgi:hypothetical protein